MSDCNLTDNYIDDCTDCYKTEELLIKVEKKNALLETELAELRERCESGIDIIEVLVLELEANGTWAPARIGKAKDFLAKYKGDKK